MTRPIAGYGAHPQVQHPSELAQLTGTVNRWLANHLSLMFGSVWTVWLFLVYPLAGLLMPARWQTLVFFVSSGWIQLWALPLLNLASNRAGALQQAKADTDHRALLHIARELDAIKAQLGVAPATDDARVATGTTQNGDASG